MAHLLLDTGCILALVASWHERHDDVSRAVEQRMKKKARLALTEHSLIETYALLTRLPAPWRLGPADAHALLSKNFSKGAKLATLHGPEHLKLLDRLLELGLTGGHSYHALTVAAAEKLTPCTLLTLDVGAYAGLDAPGLTIEEP